MNISNINPKSIDPSDALKLNDDLKRLYFKNAVVKHARVDEIYLKLDILTAPYSGTDLIMLLGPTGVGKTLVVNKFKEQIIKKYMEEMYEDRSFIPVALVEAPKSGGIYFDWRVFHNRLLKELKEPLIDKKIKDFTIDNKRLVHNVTHISYLSGLRECIEDALGYRRTYLVIIDEAVHLFRSKNIEIIENNVETIKSIANISGTNFLLVGFYDLFNLLSINEQTTRRSFIVHFQRYLNDDEGKKAFEKSLKKLQEALPIKNLPDLRKQSDKLMQRCAGCVGTLKDTLSRALSISLIQFKGYWNDICLEKALLPEPSIYFILEKIEEGEISIKNSTFG